MPLDANDLATLSRLLDEALDLAPHQLDHWLAALPPEQQRLRPQLQEMLAQHVAQGHAGFLSDGPRLDGDASDPSGPRAGERIGPYVLIRELGRGGMGTVWLAARADGTLKRQVALKLPRLAWGPGLARRMARERDIVARLAHPNIARLYDAGMDEQGRPYLALEFVDGQPIDIWCEARALPLRKRLALVMQVARAVGHAHGSLVVHRDLKPSNILVTQDGEVHLLDFGIAKLLEAPDGPDSDVTQTQARLLTPRYASPEQADGRPVTVASDVYSLGVVLHQLLTGSLPSLDEDPTPASRSVVERGAARALRGDLDAIIGKALRHDPARRYATMEAFANDLENHLAGRPVQARPDGAFYIAGRFVRRHWFGLSAATAIGVAIVVGGATAIVQARHAEREAERARAATEFVSELFRLNAAAPESPGAAAAPTEFIDRGALLIQTRFAGQPEMQADLLGAVGQAYGDVGANALAADYANRRLRVLRQLPDSRNAQVQSLLLASGAYLNDEEIEAAEVAASSALDLTEPRGRLRLDALAALAQAQLENGHLESARKTVETGLDLLAAAPALQQSASAARLLAAQAMMLIAQDRLEESRTISARVVALALATEGPGSRTGEDLLFRRSMALLNASLIGEAHASFEQSMTILRQRGGILARVRESVNSIHFWSSAWGAGDVNFEDAQKRVQASRQALIGRNAAVPSIVLAKIDLDLGSMYVNWSEVQKAKQWLEPSAATLLASRPSLRMRNRIAQLLAHLHHLTGEDDLALKEAQDFMATSKLLFGLNNHTVVYSYGRLVGELVWQGKLDAAQAVLDEVPLLADAIHQRVASDLISLGRSQLAMARGDVRKARKSLPPLGNDAYSVDLELMPQYGSLVCETGEPERGLAIMREAIRDVLAMGTFVHDPDIALDRSLEGICALTMGRRALALRCALDARRAFNEEQLIGPRYLIPLNRLERALHVHDPNPSHRSRSTLKASPEDNAC